MKFKLTFYEREVYIITNESDSMKVGEIMASIWPKYDEMDKLLQHLKTILLWNIDAEPGDESYHYELTDESEIMLVFSESRPQSLYDFKDKLYKGWD